MLEQGASILSSLFGNSTISGIVNVLSRFASIAPGAAEKLLGYLTPLVLGTIASKFNGKTMNGQGLADMFAEEKGNIAHAHAARFLALRRAGPGAAGSAVRTAARSAVAPQPAMMRYVLPLAGIVCLAFLLWNFLPSKGIPEPEPKVQTPDVTRGAVTR